MKRALALIPLLLLAACHRPVVTQETLPDAAPPDAIDHAVLGPGDTVQGVSIYALDATLTDQSGASMKLDRFRGHPVVISMFYSSCPHACPTLIRNVQRIEAALSPAVRDQVRVLLVSFDPAHDTPEALRAVVTRHRLDPARWTLATTSEEQVRDIAAVLGIKYRQADGSFNHSSVITLLDSEGRIDRRSDGLADATADLAARLTVLASAP